MTSDNDVKDKTASDETKEEESSEESLAEEKSDAEQTPEESEESSPEDASSDDDASDEEEVASDDDNDDDASDEEEASAADDDEEDEEEASAADDDEEDEEEASAADDDDDDDDEEEEASDDDDDDEEEEASDDDDDDEEEASEEEEEVASDDDDDDDDDDEEEASEEEEEVASDDDDEEEAVASDDDDEKEIVVAGENGDSVVPRGAGEAGGAKPVKGIAAFFDLPDDLMVAAAHTRDSQYEAFDAYSPFPIHGMDDAMGIGRSWIPWVTFGAGTAGFLTANALQFGTMTFDWPMIIGGKPYAPWPAFVPIMFELTVLLAGVITAIVMLVAAGCFRKPFIIDREITKDRFALWISADDESFDADEVREFMKTLDPVEIRTITESA